VIQPGHLSADFKVNATRSDPLRAGGEALFVAVQ